MPDGKPAGTPCIHLTEDNRCALFGLPSRPQVCIDFRATPEFCGEENADAFRLLALLEKRTVPG